MKDMIIAAIVYLQDFNMVSVVIRLMLSVILSGFIGMERSKSGRAAGLRTHILVCLGATIASMTGLYINHTYGTTGDVSRIAAQVISGLSFLGAGTIIVRNKATVTGLTTAACIWVVGIIGIAIGYGFYEAAILGTLLISFITKTLNALDRWLRHNMKEMEIYVEFIDAKTINLTLDMIRKIGVEIDRVQIVQSKMNLIDGVGAEMLIQVNKKQNMGSMIEQLNAIDNVNFAVITNHQF